MNTPPLLQAENFGVQFAMYGKGLEKESLQVISNLSVTLRAGEILAIAGSSGSGKSLLAHAVMGLLAQGATTSGRLLYGGEELTPARQKQLRGSEIALIPQSVTYLDPLMKVKAQVLGGETSAEKIQRQKQVFSRLALCDKSETLYPFQLSGGMARRVLFSSAILSEAKLIIADEPTPGMHPQQAATALEILRELANENRGVLLITHDIDLALQVADRVAVFYAGTTVETAAVSDFSAGGEALRHPYSRALWRAMPQNEFAPLPGFQPYAGALPCGCLFAPRCALKTPACAADIPPMRALRGGEVRCIHAT